MSTKNKPIEEAWICLNSNKVNIGEVDYCKFSEWVIRKAKSLRKRDKKKMAKLKPPIEFSFTEQDYVLGICNAIKNNPVCDCYTGDELEWFRIGEFNNEDAKTQGKKYKAKFAMLPTVDHFEATPEPVFRICTWRTNDAKNDLTLDEFRELCRKVLRHSVDDIQKE